MPDVAPPKFLPPALAATVALAVALPGLLAYNLTPSATLFNQLAALAGCGLLLCLLTIDGRPQWRGSTAGWALLLLLAVPVIATLSTGLPGALALSSCGLVGAALALLLAAQGLDAPARQRWCEAFCWGLLAAGLLSLIVGLVQVFLPAWADGTFIARSGIPGRAVGNMRQPNHLASLLMWACVAAVYLADQGRLNRLNGRKGLNGLKASAPVALPLPLLLFALVFAVVLSASRTGMVGVLVLAAWGLLDRKLQRATRWALIATPLMLALSWGLLAVWAGSGGGHAFGAESRLSEEGAGSPSRLAILANAWALVKMHPLAGVGWGGFNFAWTMTPFPNRPIAFFDHTHDLPMQLAVELGLPLALLILGLLGWSLWRALRMSMRAQGGDAVARRCTFMMVITIGLHSLLEYPLWYAYFLLPAAFAFGLSLGRLDGADAPQRAAARDISLPLRLAGLLMIAGSAFAVWDYLRIVDIYAPKANAASLEQRIAIGQRSPFFSALADYAAATSLPPGPAALAAARRTAHNLIDVRLMMAWAKSLEATGDVDRARYVVQRLREFRSREGADWLAECAAFKPQERKPFQCEPPSREYRYEEMR